MAQVQKISIALTPDMAGLVREAVEGGEYASASEVIREALREWKLRRLQRESAVEELRRLVREGLDSGEPLDGPAFMDSLRAELKAKADSQAQ